MTPSRIRLRVVAVLPLAFMLLLAGCTGDPNRSDGDADTLDDMPPRAVAFEHIDTGIYPEGPDGRNHTIITNENAWDAFWLDHRTQRQSDNDTGNGSRPTIDLSERFVAFVYAGRQTDAGISAQIIGVNWTNGVYHIDVALNVPAEGCVPEPVATHPYTLVAIEREQTEALVQRDTDQPIVNVDWKPRPYTC